MVSIVIPTYKRKPEQWIVAVSSALIQSLREIEVLLIDDNGPGMFQQLNKEYIHKNIIDKRLRYIVNSSNLGGASARNVGIDAARYDYIAFLDDDDAYRQDKISTQLAYMKKNKLDGCFTDVEIYNPKGLLIDYRMHNYVVGTDNNHLLKMHLMHHLTPTSTYMFKSSLLEKIKGFDNTKISHDYYLMLKVLESGARVGYQPECYVRMIRGGASISSGKNKISGERNLLEEKRKYFHLLSTKEKRYILCRYHAVMAVANYRNKNLIGLVTNAGRSFFIAPITIIKEIVQFRKLIKTKSKAAKFELKSI